MFGGVRKYDINELIEACSGALSESRARYARISERTIRDDIRVMRSDILGFNAPIMQSGGLYFYSDPKYTILSVGINDPGILQMVIQSLMKLRTEVKHPELEKILEKLQVLSPENFEQEYMLESRIDRNEKLSTPDVKVKNIFPMFSMEEYLFETDPLQILLMDSQFLRQVSWGEVMKLV
jgi:hypothetical protein